MKKLQQKVYRIIRDHDRNTLSANLFDGVIILLILFNILVVVLDTFEMPPWYARVSSVVETVSIVVFTAEYLLRLWTSPFIYPDKSPMRARLKYAFTFMAVIDLLSILPFYLPIVIVLDLRVLRSVKIFRLLRVFKVGHYTDALSAIGRVIRSKAKQLVSSLLVVMMLILIASVLMYNVENAAQPDKFENAFSALWWAVSAVTTTGYGDVYPITPLGQLLGVLTSVLGIGLVAIPTGIISAGFIQDAARQDASRQDAAHQGTAHPGSAYHRPLHHTASRRSVEQGSYCPHCGKKIR